MTIYLDSETIRNEVVRVLLTRAVPAEQARLFANIIVENSLDGVTSHGITRFPAYIGNIDDGFLNPEAVPECIAAHGAIEQWDGHRTLGPLACTRFMQRATELAQTHGIGCVAGRNSTHWLRAATYSRQAARAGLAAICWTNARPAMPAWGGKELRLGNNPISIAVPGTPPVVVDMAMSQFSFGRIQESALAKRALPVPGGIGFDGKPTNDASEIMETLKAGAYRLIPTGFWKGSALAFTLDALAAVLSGGLASREVETETPADIGVSQIFIAFDLSKWIAPNEVDDRIAEIVHHLKNGHNGVPDDVTAPGEGTERKRQQNERDGIPVAEEIWKAVCAL